MDALDRVYKRFGKKEKIAWAKNKAAEDEKNAVTDRKTVSKLASAFERKVAEDRRRAGL